jgi:tetratricopeptide (TPR) repeat protein
MRTNLETIGHALTKAKYHAPDSTELEQALIEAIQSRVPKGLQEQDFKACNKAYTEAMESVYERFSADLDVTALFADSAMNLSAWNLWDLKTGKPSPGSRSLEVRGILEEALKQEYVYNHPGILHLYIHLMEMSSTPEVALVAADHLRNLVPDAGHLLHMPSHLNILVGDYQRATASNTAACLADEKYHKERGGENFYSFYRMHDYHSLIYAAMFAGQSKVALRAVSRMEWSLPVPLLSIKSPPMADWLENFSSVRVHVLVRFGRWQDLLSLSFPNDTNLYCVTTAMIHYGKGVAYAATGDVENALRERAALKEAVKRIPSSRICGDFPNKSNVVLQIGEAMLDGEIAYRQGNYDIAFGHLEEAIKRDDALTYAEPWPVCVPSRTPS